MADIKFEIIKKIGRGKYSEVYQGINTKNDQKVVLKVLKPVKKNKIRREIKILETLKNGPNVVKLLDVVRDPSSKMPCIVTEWIDNDEWKTISPTFTDEEVRFYLYQVLVGLDYCHSKGIMHRDIKPHNFIINHSQKPLKIIDWGLAEYYLPEHNYNVRVASRYYKGPELLVDDELYEYSLDIWSLGCTMAALIFRKDPFFQGNDNEHQLFVIAQVLGTDALYAYTRKYGLTIKNTHLDNGSKK